MLIDVNLIFSGNTFSFHSAPHEQSAYVSCGNKHFIIPVDVISLSLGTNHFYVACEEKNMAGRLPFNVRIYDYNGNYLWNTADIISLENKKIHQWFYGIHAHTKETLSKSPWNVLIGSENLPESHEYLTAYDGGQQWLFDVTGKRFINRVFTH